MVNKRQKLIVDHSVAYCTYKVQTKLMLKNQIYPQKFMFTATEGPTNMPLVVLEYSVGVVGY
jgi:hypothetical protein